MNHPEQQYLDLLKDILDQGVKQTDQGTGVTTISLFGRQMRFTIDEGFPLLTTKRVYWKGVVEELRWFMTGETNIRSLVEANIHIWDKYPFRIYKEKMEEGEVPEMDEEEFIENIAADPEFAQEHGELPHCYGEMWRRWKARDGREVDQLGWVVEQLKRDPDNHNALVTSWNPEYMYEMAPEREGLRFPICHNMFQFNQKDGKLHLHLYQRSADMFLGVPFNIASYALLLVVVSKITGYTPGEFVHTFGDFHIYENHIEQVKEQISREPKPLPSVEVSDLLTSIDSFESHHVTLHRYDPHPVIKGDLTPTGGVSTDQWKDYVQTGN